MKRVLLRTTLGAVAAYLLTAYLILPRFVERRVRQQSAPPDNICLTHTASGLPGDPVNVSLIGTEDDVIRALLAAGWRPADALSFRSSVRIAVDTVLDKPDENAPVSNLYLFGRKEDLAFEKPIGHSPRERHHVRFWRSDTLEASRPVWYGAATHDVGVELSRATGQVTHRIAPDVDTERNMLMDDLAKAVHPVEVRTITGFHKVLQGRNGGGNPWYTDGRLRIAVLPPSPPNDR